MSQCGSDPLRIDPGTKETVDAKDQSHTPDLEISIHGVSKYI